MKNNNWKFITVFVILILSLSSVEIFATTNESKNNILLKKNTYKLKFIEPISRNISLNAKTNPIVKVKISFDAKKAVDDELQFEVFADGEVIKNTLNIDMNPIVEDTLDARTFLNGKHVIEYCLTPGFCTEVEKAVVKIRIDLTVTDSIEKEELNLADAQIPNVFKTIQNNDEKALIDLLMTKADADAIAKKITGNSKEDKKAKGALTELLSKKIKSKPIKNFREFQKALIKKNIDRKSVELALYNEKEIIVQYPLFKVLRRNLSFRSDKFFGELICVLMVTKNKAYVVNMGGYIGNITMPFASQGYEEDDDEEEDYCADDYYDEDEIEGKE